MHASSSSCWVSRDGKVYDVTRFLDDHPGGDDLILKYAGKDIGETMKDPVEHEHSDSAYDMLDEFLIGRLGKGESVVSDGKYQYRVKQCLLTPASLVDWVPADDFHPEETDLAKDYEKNQFLDLRKPMLMQLLRANFSKSYYLQQVHQPRHLTDSAPLFGPVYLEVGRLSSSCVTRSLTCSGLQVFSKTPWYVIPAIWLPIAGYLFLRSLLQYTLGNNALPLFTSDPVAPFRMLLTTSITPTAFALTMACFFFGNLVWTFLEYTLHRFLFHLDFYLPDHPAALAIHFTLHGIHHYLPMDR